MAFQFVGYPGLVCGGGGMILVQPGSRQRGFGFAPAIAMHHYGGIMPVALPMNVVVEVWQCKYCRAGPFENKEACLVNTQYDANQHRSSCQRVIDFERAKQRDYEQQWTKERQAEESRRKAEELARKESQYRSASENVLRMDF
jgi:hypothetical protein